MSQSPPTDSLLASFLADELSAPDRAQVEAWLASSPAHRAELERLRALMQQPAAPSRWNVDRAWSQVEAQLTDNPSATALPRASGSLPAASPTTTSRSRQRARPWYGHVALRAAAAMLVVAGAGYLWNLRQPISATDAQYATAVGETRDIMLPDSTEVALGPASTLRVVDGYGGNARTVELSGEAWFRVRHDDSQPFSVRAAGTITLDVGTEFSVRAVEGDTVVRVEVFEGAASLRRADRAVEAAVMLRENDVGTLTASQSVAQVAKTTAASPAWRKRRLTFEQAPLSEIASELRRWYPITLMVSDSAMRQRVSATLPTGDFNEALDILRLALGVTIELRGDTVHVR